MAHQETESLCLRLSTLTFQGITALAHTPSTLGDFGILPMELRLMIWEFCVRPIITSLNVESRKRAISLMRVSSSIYTEVYHILYHRLILSFTIGTRLYRISDHILPSGIEISDENNIRLGFIPCEGPVRYAAVMNGKQMASKLPFHRAQAVIFNVRPVDAGDLSSFLWTWFEALQMAKLIAAYVPQELPIDIRIHTNDRKVKADAIAEIFRAPPCEVPAKMVGALSKTTVGLLVIPFLDVFVQRPMKVAIKLIGPHQEWYMAIAPDTTYSDLSASDKAAVHLEGRQKENIITFWLYQHAMHLPGKIGSFWRLRLFAEWDRQFENDLACQLFENGIDKIRYSQPNFHHEILATVGQLYANMRAFNPSSFWQAYSRTCWSRCCGGKSEFSGMDYWSKAAWYSRYPQGIDHQGSAHFQYIMRSYGDPRLTTTFTSSGLNIISQTHPLHHGGLAQCAD